MMFSSQDLKLKIMDVKRVRKNFHERIASSDIYTPVCPSVPFNITKSDELVQHYLLLGLCGFHLNRRKL